MDRRLKTGFVFIAGLTLCAILTIFILEPGEAEGETNGEIITVDDDGEADYPRIQWAIDNASRGDTIRVFDGEYSEALNINKTLSIIGMALRTLS